MPFKWRWISIVEFLSYNGIDSGNGQGNGNIIFSFHSLLASWPLSAALLGLCPNSRWNLWTGFPPLSFYLSLVFSDRTGLTDSRVWLTILLSYIFFLCPCVSWSWSWCWRRKKRRNKGRKYTNTHFLLISLFLLVVSV